MNIVMHHTCLSMYKKNILYSYFNFDVLKNTLSILIMLLISQVSLSQIDNDLVELDEIVLSIPFSQTLGKSVIKVDKINFNEINPIIKQYINFLF